MPLRVYQLQGVMSSALSFPLCFYQLHQLVIKLLAQDQRKAYNFKNIYLNPNWDVYLMLLVKNSIIS